MQQNDAHSKSNGFDSLSLTLTAAAILFLLLGRLTGVFYFLAGISLAFAVWRACSKNLATRQAENYKFMHITGDMREGYERWRFRSQHCYFKCEQCGAKVAANPDLGEVTLVCPNCGHKFTTQT